MKPGDFISGLTYHELLNVEEKLRMRIKNAHMLFTGNGYGFISKD